MEHGIWMCAFALCIPVSGLPRTGAGSVVPGGRCRL